MDRTKLFLTTSEQQPHEVRLELDVPEVDTNVPGFSAIHDPSDFFVKDRDEVTLKPPTRRSNLRIDAVTLIQLLSDCEQERLHPKVAERVVSLAHEIVFDNRLERNIQQALAGELPTDDGNVCTASLLRIARLALLPPEVESGAN